MSTNDPELHAARLALRRAEAASYPTPLDALRAAVDELLGTFGLDTAPALLELCESLDPGQDEDDGEDGRSEAIQRHVAGLTLALERVRLASREAFSPASIKARQDAVTDAAREAYQAGFRIGFTDGRICERYECLSRHVWIPRAPTVDGMWDRCSSDRTTKCVR